MTPVKRTSDEIKNNEEKRKKKIYIYQIRKRTEDERHYMSLHIIDFIIFSILCLVQLSFNVTIFYLISVLVRLHVICERGREDDKDESKTKKKKVSF